MTVTSPQSDFNFKTTKTCSKCKTDYPDLTISDIRKVQDKIVNLQEFVTTNGSTCIVLKIPNEIIIFVLDCPNCVMNNQLALRERAEIGGKILSDFLYSLIEGVNGGERAVELSALRQINQIVLNFFQGQDNAMSYAFNLVLSAFVILLDAKGSWLEYQDGDRTVLLIKGEEQAVKQVMGDVNKNFFIIEAPIQMGGSIGTLGILEPNDHQRAQSLLPLMAQECTIVFEIQRLFELVQAQFTKVLGSIRSGVILINKSKAIIYTNNSFANLINKPVKSILNMSISAFHAPWVSYVTEERRLNATGIMDFWHYNGKDHWLNWQLCPLFDESNFSGWILLVDDESDQYRLQVAVRQAERLGVTATMVGALAHELRNPLSAAKGLVQLLARKQDPVKVRGYSDLIIKELDRVTSLLNEFLLLGKPTSISSQPLDLQALLNELWPLLEGEAFHYNTKIIADFCEVTPIDGDSGQLTQVVFNLVRNAIQAAGEDGQVTLNLEQKGDWVELSVKDNGLGLPPNIESQIFDPFFSTKPHGIGLGLSVVQTIINNHGGKIKAGNLPEGGAVFTVYLPASKKTPKKFIDIVLIMANTYRRFPLEQMFRQTGYKVLTFEDLEEDYQKELQMKYQPRLVILPFSIPRTEQFVKNIWPKAELLVIDKCQFRGEGCWDLTCSSLDYAYILKEARKMLELKK